MRTRTLVIVLLTTVGLGVVFHLTPYWVRGAAVGFLFGLVLALNEHREHVLQKHQKKLEHYKKGKENG